MNSHRTFRRWVLVADLVWLGIGMSLAWLMRYGAEWNPQQHSAMQIYTLTLLGAGLIWSVLWACFDLDGSKGGWRLPAIISHLLLAVAIVMVTLLSLAYVLRIYESRLVLGYFGVMSLTGFVLIRAAARSIVGARCRDGAVRRVVIAGSGPVAREIAMRLEVHPEKLCKVIGFLSPLDVSLELLQPGAISNAQPLQTAGILELMQRTEVDELIFATHQNSRPEVAELMDQCVKRGIAVSVVPQPYELYLSTPELLDLDGIPILRLRHPLWQGKEPRWKRVMDLVLAVPLLLIALPVVLVAAVVLKIRKGTAFCKEERYGLHGEKFWLYRLNSPRKSVALPFHELVMQNLSVTELPQLFNVLWGDMSLVGPRPEGFDSVQHYTDWHRQRLNVKPGITGLAQVHGLREQNLLEDKTRYDLQYILHRTLFQDLSLLLQTIWTLIHRLTDLKHKGVGQRDALQESSPSGSFAA
jgi:lipopolysaccharide/colanic/teichoic acid biosynthesis glycosyltransferase